MVKLLSVPTMSTTNFPMYFDALGRSKLSSTGNISNSTLNVESATINVVGETGFAYTS